MSLCEFNIENSVARSAAPEGMVRVIYSRNPFDTSKHKHTFVEVGDEAGFIEAISEEVQAMEEALVVTSLNGEIITKSEWENRSISSGDVVVVFEVPGGGDDSKAILRLVAMLVLVVAAPFAGAALGLEGAAAAAFEVAFVVAGSLLINAILPPVSMDGVPNDSTSDSRTYGIDGAKNTSEEGAVIPVIYGPFRMAGNIINYHVRNQGDDQYLYVLLNAGEGVSGGITDVQLNEQDIAGFLNAETQIRLGNSNDEVINWFQETIQPNAVGVTVTTSFQQRTTGLIDRFRLDFVCPAGLVVYNDDGSRSSMFVEFQIQYKKTSEPTVWTTLKDNGKVSSSSDEYEYFDADDYDSQGQVTGTTLGERRPELRAGDFELEGIVYGPTTNNKKGVKKKKQNYALPTSIELNQTSAARFSYFSKLLDQDTYDIRVRRLVAESTDDKTRDAVGWTDWNEIIVDKVGYKHTALVGLKVKLTDQLSSLPSITYINQGRVIKYWDTANQVWLNGPSANPAWIAYDAFTNQRFGGQMSEDRLDIDAWQEWGEYCDNEGLTFQGVFDTRSNLWDATMHVFRAGHARPLRMGTKYTIAIDREASPSQMFTTGNIIKGSFSQTWMSLKDRANEIELSYFDETDRFKRRTIKVYDEGVVSGIPINTASATMFGIVDKTRAAEEATYMLLNNRYIKSTVSFQAPMEAIAVTIGDVFVLQHDQPNWSVGGRLASGGTQLSMALDKVVDFDGAKSYKFMVRYDAITRITATVNAKVGNKLTLSGAYSGETNINRCQVSTDTSIDQRITRVSSDSIWVDDATDISVSDVVYLIETDAIETRDVTAATSGSLSAVPLASAMPSSPSEHFLYMVGEEILIDSEWRVTKIDIDGKLVATISGATYDARIYNWTPLTVQPAPDTGTSRIVPHVTNLSVEENNVNIGGILRPTLDISWDLPDDFENYAGVLIETSVDGGGYEFAKIQRGGLHTSIEVNHNDNIDVRVVAMSSDGRYALNSSAPEVTGITVVGDAIPPAAPTSVTLATATVGLRLDWVKPIDADFAGLDIKRNVSNDEPGATIIYTTAYSQLSLDDVLATDVAEDYYYWVRSVDRSGNTSAWVATSPTNETPTDFGIDATSGFLTNEQHGVPADSDGSNPVFSGANGEFHVIKGITDITSLCTFSVLASDNLTGTINTALNNPVTGPKGYYEVTAETSPQDIHAFVVRAFTPDAIAIDKTFTLTKNKQGAEGTGIDAQTVQLSAEGLIFSYDNTTGTEVLIDPTAIVLTVNEQNTTGSTTWLAWDDAGVPISPVSNLLTSVTDAGATITEANFDGIANNNFVSVRATRNGISDEVSVYKVVGGEDGATGSTGFSSATASLYNKNTSAVTPPSAFSGTFTYTFANALLTGGTLNGWTQSAPDISAGEYLWVRQAAAVSQGSDDTIAAAEFSGAVVVGVGGTDGIDGLNSATAPLYHKNTSDVTPPATFTGTFTYTFSTALLSGGTFNGWSQTPPDIAAGEYLWLAQATASSATDTDSSIPSAEFSTPAVISIGGSDGTDGQSIRQVNLYKLNDSTLTDNTQGTFADPKSGMEAGWDYSVPGVASDSDIVYVISRTFTNDAASPQDATWAAPTKYAERTDGTDAINSRYPTIYKLNDSTITDDTQGTFADPLSGMEAGWGYNVPTLANDGDITYVSSRIFTSDGSAPQEANWATPTVYARRIDGIDGLNSATASLYHKGTSPVTPPAAFSGTWTYTFSTSLLSGGTFNGWSQTAPEIVAGEYLWVRQAAAVSATDTDSGILTSEFSSAVVIGVAGESGLHNAIVFMYDKNSSGVTPPTALSGSFTYTFDTAILSGGTPEGWTQSAPDISPGEYLWLTQATASSITNIDSVASGEFSTPAVIALGGIDGDTGPKGLRTVQGYLYYEKSITPATPPAAPTTTGDAYTFSTGVVSSADITDGAIDKWSNAPRTADATTASQFYAVRYYGTESAADSPSITTLLYTNVVETLDFSGVVRFSGGTLIDDLGGSVDPLAVGEAAADINANVTTIDGGKITTNTITATQLSTTIAYAGDIIIGDGVSGSIYSQGKTSYGDVTAGFWMGYDSGSPAGYKFDIGDANTYLRWTGTAVSVQGNVNITSGSVLVDAVNTEDPETGIDGRVHLSKGGSPIEIYNDADVNVMVIESATNDLLIRGRFVNDTIDDADMFTDAGIDKLHERLGTSTPASSTGGTVSWTGSQSIHTSDSSFTSAQTVDGVTGGTAAVGELNHGTEDITLKCTIAGSQNYTFKTTNYGWIAPVYTITWESNKDGEGWIPVAGLSQQITGSAWNEETESEPGYERYSGGRSISGTASKVWSSPAVGDYFFRAIVTRNSTWSTSTPTNLDIDYVAGQEAIVGGGTIQNLPDLGDVTSAATTNRYALMGNGSAYVGRAVVKADISDVTFSATAGNNTAVLRNGSGYVLANYFNASSGASNPGSGSMGGAFIGTNGTDTYMRSYTPAAALARMGAAASSHGHAASALTAGSMVSGVNPYITATGSSASYRMIFRSNSNASGASPLYCDSASNIYYNPSTNTLSVTNINALSDVRLKENIRPYDYNVTGIHAKSFTFKRSGVKKVGYIAQEVQKVMPDAVTLGEDGMLTVDYISILVAKVEELERRLAEAGL